MYLLYRAGTLSLSSILCLYLVSCAYKVSLLAIFSRAAHLACYAYIYYTYLVCYDYSVIVLYLPSLL